MFSSKHYINLISLIIIGLIGGLFVFKYSARVTEYNLIFSFLFLLIFYSVPLFLQRIDVERYKIFNKRNVILIFSLLTVGFIILLNYIPVETRVSRYLAIETWLSNLLNNHFPYDSHVNPSGFPFLFFLALPFHFLGDAGYLTIIGFSLAWLVVVHTSKTAKERVVRLSMLLLLPVLYYEIIVRSELLANMMFVIFLLFIADKFLNSEKRILKLLITALLFGLFLSTRGIVGIIYIIAVLYFFRDDLLKGFYFSFIVITTFILLLLPFYLWDSETFIKKGPFAIQMLYLPVGFLIFFFIISVYTGWIVSSMQEVLFSSGLIIFLIVTVSFIITIFDTGFYNSVYKDRFDITYFIFSVPFFILSIKEYRIDKFLGKVLVD